MKSSRFIAQSLLIIPVVAVLASFGLFFWLSSSNPGYDEHGSGVAQVGTVSTSDRNSRTQTASAISSNADQATADRKPYQSQSISATKSSSPGTKQESAQVDGFESLQSAEETDAIVVTGADIFDNGRNDLTPIEPVDDQPSSVPAEVARDREDVETAETDQLEEEEEDEAAVENSGADVLAGRVVDKRGLAVAGLSITASRRDEGRSFASTVRTDANGGFEYRDIATGEYLLETAESRAYPSVSRYARSGDTSTTIVVYDRSRLEVVGRITREDGQPLEAVTVSAPGTESRTTSDASGAYRIAIESTSEKGFVLMFAATGFMEELARIDAETGDDPVVVDQVMRPFGQLSVSGQVLDPQSNPVEGALVQLTSRDLDFHNSTLTAKDGQFVLTGLPPASDYHVKASSSSAYGVWQRENVEIAASVNLPITLPTIGSGRVVGSIVDLNGTPLPQFSLYAIRSDVGGGVVDVRSDDSGYFDIDSFPSDNLSFVSQSEPEIQISGARVSDDAEAQLTLVVNIGPHKLHGRVVTLDEEVPIVGAVVTMTWHARFGILQSRVTHTTSSDARGYFHFSRLGEGDWTLTIHADGLEPASYLARPGKDQPGAWYLL